MYATQFSYNFKTTSMAYMVKLATEDHCKVHNQIIYFFNNSGYVTAVD